MHLQTCNVWLPGKRLCKRLEYILCTKCSFAQSYPLFATPLTAARQASQSITNSGSLLKVRSIDSVMASKHLILCRPLLPPSIFPSIRVFSNESVLCIRWPEYWSFSFSISPSNEYSGRISFRMNCLDAQSVGLQNSKLMGLVWRFIKVTPAAVRAMHWRGGGETGQSWGKQWGDPIRYVMKGARTGMEGSRGAEKWSEPMTSLEKGRKADQATPHSPAAPSGQMASGSEPGRVLTRNSQPLPLRGGEGNGNPLQYSCLENPVDRGAWWAVVHRVA